MNPLHLIRRLRAFILTMFGIDTDERDTAAWWEVDLIIVLLAGAWAAGIAAFFLL